MTFNKRLADVRIRLVQSQWRPEDSDVNRGQMLEAKAKPSKLCLGLSLVAKGQGQCTGQLWSYSTLKLWVNTIAQNYEQLSSDYEKIRVLQKVVVADSYGPV